MTHLKEVAGVSYGGKEVVPESHLGLASTGTDRLQELRKLFDKLHYPRQEGVCGHGGMGTWINGNIGESE